jgi:3-(3-hydroxy-phenyl)propionate hydroxylase
VDDPDFDIIVIGAGPTGLTIANFLGQEGIRVLVLEGLDNLIDYPRGVALDDEALRSFQLAGLDAKVVRHTTPQHIARFIKPNGKLLAEINPLPRPYGWARRNAFNQPLIDRELLEGLKRFPNVEVRFGSRMTAAVDTGDMAKVEIENGGSATARYVIGCDGGRSPVRETMGVAFEGKTAPDRFLVVDLANDPVGRPNVDFILHPTRPIVSIALPAQLRRFEFGVEDHEIVNEFDVTEAALRDKLRDIFTDVEIDRLHILRRRVYTHNARIASSFQKGRLLIAGDAAHVMPVWQGQGFNTGIRDATNLGWKLSLVIKGLADEKLLDTYDVERRAHAKAMIDVSVMIGRIFAPSNIFVRWVRDFAFAMMAFIPPLKAYVTSMRWKPMPRMTNGAVVRSKNPQKPDIAGTIFPQFAVNDGAGERRRSDDAVGCGFVILSWGVDPLYYADPAELARFRKLGGRVFAIFPECQREKVQESEIDAEPLFDPDGQIKAWFDDKEFTTILVRPDRIVGACGRPVDINTLINRFCDAAHIGTGVKA